MPKRVKRVELDEVAAYLTHKGLRQTTIDSYIQKIRRVMKNIYGEEMPKVSDLKKDYKKMMEEIEGGNYKNANSKKVHGMGMCHLLECYNVDASKMMTNVKTWTAISQAESVNQTTEEEIDKIMKVDFDKIRAEVKTEQDPTNRLIKAFYSGMIPPVRQQDLLNLRVCLTKDEKEMEGNYLNISKGEMVIREHKTKRTHGAKTIKLPKELCDEVRAYMLRHATHTLFPFSTGAFNHRMTRMFGFGCNVLRKAYISKYTPTMSAEQLYECSQAMGHRISTQMVSYRKMIQREAAAKELKPPEPVSSETEDDE